ncbi:hypothetical protein B0H13DRAFT_2351455 [Mycena leptocephala]|nr:hypothetical protein B0H13DRAFT_2351455 [Mycena leptocephala]
MTTHFDPQAKFEQIDPDWLFVDHPDSHAMEINDKAAQCMQNLDVAIEHLTTVSVALKEEWEAEQIIAQRLATLLRACRERHKHLDKLLDDLHLS